MGIVVARREDPPPNLARHDYNPSDSSQHPLQPQAKAGSSPLLVPARRQLFSPLQKSSRVSSDGSNLDVVPQTELGDDEFPLPAATSPILTARAVTTPSPARLSPEGTVAASAIGNADSNEIAMDGNSYSSSNCIPRKKKKVRFNDDAVTTIPSLSSGSFLASKKKSKKGKKKETTRSTTTNENENPNVCSAAAATTGEVAVIKKASLWWTKEERNQIQIRNRRSSREFKRMFPEQTQRSNQIYAGIAQRADAIANAAIGATNGSRDEDDALCSDSSTSDEEEDHNEIYSYFQRQRSASPQAVMNECNETAAAANGRKRKRAAVSSTAPAAPAAADSSASPPSATENDNVEVEEAAICDCGSSTGATEDNYDDFSLSQPLSSWLWPATNVRGLEWGIVPDAKIHRKTHTKTVLQRQDRLRKRERKRRRRLEESVTSDDDTSSEDDDEGCSVATAAAVEQERNLLASEAILSSLRSRELARVLAVSDAVEAIRATSASSYRDDDGDDEQDNMDSSDEDDD